MDLNQERTWVISIHVTDLFVDKTLRVNGDLHVGGVMFKLVESLAVPADWSDHALWWPEKCLWLNKSRVTLNQYGVHADAKLHFTPMHKTMRIQLPDLQLIDLKIDFSVNVFNAVLQLCKEMGVRHPEELSLLRPKTVSKDKKAVQAPIATTINRNSRASSSSNSSLNKGMTPASPLTPSHRTPLHVTSPVSTMSRTSMTPQTPGTPGSWVNGMSPQALTRSLSFDENLYSQLVHSPKLASKEALLYLPKHKNLTEKAVVNGWWLDSNRSLMEQAVQETDLLHLKFKYFAFCDLNPKYDLVRINQLYEQAKWSLISEEIDCTDEEMLMFAALQLQAEYQAQVPIHDEVDSSRNAEDHDDIDAALNDLQVSLEGSTLHNAGDITSVPELQEYIKHFKPKRYTMKGAKKYYALLRDTHIYLYKSQEETKHKSLHQINLRDCEIQPDVNLSGNKFIIRLFIPGPEGISEEWLRCENEEQYARWMAACKLGSKGHTMADSSYNAEVRNIKQFLSLQKPSSTPTSSGERVAPRRPVQPVTVPEDSILPANYMSARCLKKNKTKLVQKILEAHNNVSDMPLIEAKLNYIKAWQALPEYGLTYFLVKFRNSKKEELVGIGYNRLIRVNPKTSEVTKTYRFSTMSSWSVHWENREVIVDFEEEKLAIKPLSADCKIFHEFLGGYIYLSMRSQDKNETLNEDMFYKLTSGTCA
ncbi:fermitin family homolog 2-like [Watersipora subatra]|uniref:fermitin family homolog 2-like n=1 Tax=Watersipora subatra TaxID=2589382 RepID=UPI00355BC22D